MTIATNIEVLEKKDLVKLLNRTPPSKEWPTRRSVLLAGGALAENVDNHIVWVYPSASNKFLKFEITEYRSFASALIHLHLQPIIVTFHGGYSPENRAFNFGSNGPWLVESQAQAWIAVAREAKSQNHLDVFDLARRVAHQLRALQDELSSIANLYNRQLDQLVSQGRYENGKLLGDVISSSCYQAIQNFINNACVLRDYLAECYSRFCLSPEASKKNDVTSMKSLINKVLNKNDSGDALFNLLKKETSIGGWIKELTEYRNLVTHDAPLAIASSPFPPMVKCKSCVVLNSYEMAGITCPLPADPIALRSKRASLPAFEDSKSAWRALPEQVNGPDGLVYAHNVLSKLSGLTAAMLLKSPVEPKRRVIESSMIVGRPNVKT